MEGRFGLRAKWARAQHLVSRYPRDEVSLTDPPIREIPIFSGLTREDLDKIVDKMEECPFRAGTIIFSQGDCGDAFYFIEAGAVQVVVKGTTGRPETVALLGPKEWFGDMGLLTGELHSATVTNSRRNYTMEAQPRRLI
jgi:CRP-like cAMP-binding protein